MTKLTPFQLALIERYEFLKEERGMQMNFDQWIDHIKRCTPFCDCV